MHLGVDETRAIHSALQAFAAKVLPQYERDDGPLSVAQLREIHTRALQGTKRFVRSSLFDPDA